jgi:hypothetical protein
MLARALVIFFLALSASAADLIAFWDQPRRGANSFNEVPPDDAYFRALRAYGATWVRIAYDKWKTHDAAAIRAVLDRAHAAGLKVVIVPLSLPGARWRQHNNGRFDDRLWSDRTYWSQAAAHWRDLAAALKDHPAIAAYNLLNEPAPEFRGGLPEHASPETMLAWYAKAKGTPRDLLAFYSTLIDAIRAVDPLTPIMVDAGWYGAADAFSYWPAPLRDPRVLYSVHMYEPYSATSAPNLKREKPYVYPGVVPFGDIEQRWDSFRVAEYLAQPVAWAEQHRIPLNRLVVGEFGCVRRLPHCRQYLEDVLSALDRHNLHWAFYAFREDAWNGMDYEFTYGKPHAATPLFEPIRKRLAK